MVKTSIKTGRLALSPFLCPLAHLLDALEAARNSWRNWEVGDFLWGRIRVEYFDRSRFTPAPGAAQCDRWTLWSDMLPTPSQGTFVKHGRTGSTSHQMLPHSNSAKFGQWQRAGFASRRRRKGAEMIPCARRAAGLSRQRRCGRVARASLALALASPSPPFRLAGCRVLFLVGLVGVLSLHEHRRGQ